MKKKTLEKLKESFLAKKKEIQKRLASEETEIELDVDGDDIDRASGNVIGKLAEDLAKRQLQQLRRIEEALVRIDDGTFGECEECGEDILEKRLMAKPDATTCIVCAEKLEYERKQYA
jgi:DnaK suppressor protein